MAKAPGRPRSRSLAAQQVATPTRTKNTAPLDDEFDALLGVPEEEKAAGPSDPIDLDLALVYGGVSARWLGQVFKMDKDTVKKRLGKFNCPVRGMMKGAPLYYIHEAAPCLVNPKIDIMEYLKNIRTNDLPPHVSEAFWSAMIKRQTYEERARSLWRTSDVLEVFSNFAKEVRATVQVWPDEVQRVAGLSDKQHSEMTTMCDELLATIHRIMVEEPQKGYTPSSIETDQAE